MSRQLDKRFFGGSVDLSRMREYAELHNELKHTPDALDWFLSPESEKVSKYLGQNFQVATERPSTLRPLLRVGVDGLNFERLTELKDRLQRSGETISSNDIILLSEISKIPELHDRLMNREQMLDTLEQVYRKSAFPRQLLDQLQGMQKPKDTMPEPFRTKLIESRRKVGDDYTERPPLQELSDMQLLRVSLINEMLERGETLAFLGDLIAKDIANKTTELGGTIQLSEGAASLIETESSSRMDDNFVDYKYPLFIDGLATFHLHALNKSEPMYTGPSGWLGSGAADVGWVDKYNVTDTVFTAMGHPFDADGNPQTDKLRVNADVYFVDKRDRSNPKLRIIDLGERIVPFSSREGDQP